VLAISKELNAKAIFKEEELKPILEQLRKECEFTTLKELSKPLNG